VPGGGGGAVDTKDARVPLMSFRGRMEAGLFGSSRRALKKGGLKPVHVSSGGEPEGKRGRIKKENCREAFRIVEAGSGFWGGGENRGSSVRNVTGLKSEGFWGGRRANPDRTTNGLEQKSNRTSP